MYIYLHYRPSLLKDIISKLLGLHLVLIWLYYSLTFTKILIIIILSVGSASIVILDCKPAKDVMQKELPWCNHILQAHSQAHYSRGHRTEGLTGPIKIIKSQLVKPV